MLLKIHPENPSLKQIQTVVECLKNNGLIIYPTDTVYGLGCDIFKPKAIERVACIKGIKLDKARFSFICHDLSHLSDFCKPISNQAFKMMKRLLPGPFTFILLANNKVPDTMLGKKKTVGIRIPDNAIARQIVYELGHPIISTSVHDEDEVIEYTTDPELIFEKYNSTVDIVIDGGYGDNEASTVIDFTGDEPVVVRQGKGIIENYY